MERSGPSHQLRLGVKFIAMPSATVHSLAIKSAYLSLVKKSEVAIFPPHPASPTPAVRQLGINSTNLLPLVHLLGPVYVSLSPSLCFFLEPRKREKKNILQPF